MDVDATLEGSESGNELQTASNRSSAIASANKWRWGRAWETRRRSTVLGGIEKHRTGINWG